MYKAVRTFTLDVPVQTLLDVVWDVEHYPKFVKGVRKVTILHEMVHWGDLRDYYDQPDVLYEDLSGRSRTIDVGHQFELEAFGEIVEERNWRQYRRSKTR